MVKATNEINYFEAVNQFSLFRLFLAGLVWYFMNSFKKQLNCVFPGVDFIFWLVNDTNFKQQTLYRISTKTFLVCPKLGLAG